MVGPSGDFGSVDLSNIGISAIMSNMIEQFAQPTVGKTVRVTTRYPEYYYWATSPWLDQTDEGVVGKPDRTVPQGSFLLHTPGDPNMPTRVIALRSVIELNYLDGTPVKKLTAQDAVRTWKVPGSKGAVYTVTEERGQRRCSCPGFTFRKTCKHVQQTTSAS